GDGAMVNRDAIGTRVRLVQKDANGQELPQTREVQCVSGFSAQGDRRLLFGLGDASRDVRVHITWPDGREIDLERLEPNRYHRIDIGRNVAGR
ncbi:MAG TPA: ASPIC/UnbV domain-containing protein, partial [Candidatus Saccharimonadia bacterium]|nr:ASPIC/UnbV domain-containing protein [Candidatus Saccharimonadia bacterium]